MKFELTSETKVVLGRTLYRIKALAGFASVEKGDLGGFVEKESNLSQEGNAWVAGDAHVYGNARVAGDAQVYGNARVAGDAWVSGNARVAGDAWVSGNAWVAGDAQVYGNAWVAGDAHVYGNAGKTPIQIGGLSYSITITDNHIKIGCEFHSIRDWASFDDRRILEMDGKNALGFWKAYKGHILGIAEATGRPVASVECEGDKDANAQLDTLALTSEKGDK